MKATVTGRDIAFVILHNLIKGKKFYLGRRLLSCASELIVFDLLPKLGVHAEGLHLVADFLHQALGGVRNRTELLAVLEFLAQILLNRLDEVVQISQVLARLGTAHLRN